VAATAPLSHDRDQRIAAVRRFSRFYTRQIGLLQDGMLASPFSLAEARVLYELAQRRTTTASALAGELGLDPGYLSRMLRGFSERGLIAKSAAPDDRRQTMLSLTARGRKAYAPLEQRSQRDTGALLGKLEPSEQARLIAAMTTIETLLRGETASQPGYILRAPRPGDFGWIVKRNAELYAQEYQWKEPFEGVCAQIVADFASKFDPKRERCWIAEMNGENVGCIFLAKDSATVARVRLLLVDPKARGLGLGAHLVDECLRFARRAGYNKITLWTHSVLTAARHIYEKAGFKLMRTERHKDWGPPVVSEHWDLEF